MLYNNIYCHADYRWEWESTIHIWICFGAKYHLLTVNEIQIVHIVNINKPHIKKMRQSISLHNMNSMCGKKIEKHVHRIILITPESKQTEVEYKWNPSLGIIFISNCAYRIHKYITIISLHAYLKKNVNWVCNINLRLLWWCGDVLLKLRKQTYTKAVFYDLVLERIRLHH